MEQNEKNIEFMLKVKEIYEALCEAGEASIRAVATEFGLSRTKVRKILVTLGVIKNDITEKALELKKQGMNLEQIADEMGLSMATVSTYLPYDTIIYNGEEKSYNAAVIERYRQRNKNIAKAQVHNSSKNINIYEEKQMKERQNKIYKLHLELNTDGVDMEVLKKYGKVKKGISRDVLVPADITLHALHYVIQRAFGWQNAHLHHFELPENVFKKITKNNFGIWSNYCGIYFRFPDDDMEDIYWDDDYYGDVSIKTWMRKKYTGPYQYHGISEHLMEARYAVVDFMDNNQQIRVNPPFDVWMKMTDEEREKPIIKPLINATCDEMNMVLGNGGTYELLERLKASEVFAECEVEPIPENFVKETLARCNENVKEFVRLHNAMVNDDNGYEYWCKMNEINGRTYPITKSLLYKYDYGDGWEVRIDIEDMYYSDSKWDHPDKAGFVTVSLTTEQVYEEQTPLYKTGEIIEGELSEQIKAVVVNLRPVCIATDGLPVLDDVGGIGGYCGMLLGLHGKDCGGYSFDNAEETKEWTSDMGWTGRMNKPDKIL